MYYKLLIILNYFTLFSWSTSLITLHTSIGLKWAKNVVNILDDIFIIFLIFIPSSIPPVFLHCIKFWSEKNQGSLILYIIAIDKIFLYYYLCKYTSFFVRSRGLLLSSLKMYIFSSGVSWPFSEMYDSFTF